jgi:hypothetical protein
MVSYGESVRSCRGLDYRPFVEPAERMAEFYNNLLPNSGPIHIIRRSWYCVTDPNLVTVEVHFR